MLISNSWKEYEVLDAGDGAKLERWGHDTTSFTLSRPDPQLIWPRKHPELWSKADGIYMRNETGAGKWKFSKDLPARWQINYRDLKFWVSPTDFKHTGIFPEQATNWDWVRHQIGGAGRKINLLNLFGYTGGATIAALSAGASVCNVDASSTLYCTLVIVLGYFAFDRPLAGWAKAHVTGEAEGFWKIVTNLGLGVGSLHGETTSDEIALPISGSDFVLPAGITTRWYK
ncbi:MAG: class I SAM-dependent methyltransferase [Candidatus Vogelbacteria bacterium]|nr:class I SAM-dependent methyltransferase [Candidatus Vogelbacteria bacterium]